MDMEKIQKFENFLKWIFTDVVFSDNIFKCAVIVGDNIIIEQKKFVIIDDFLCETDTNKQIALFVKGHEIVDLTEG